MLINTLWNGACEGKNAFLKSVHCAVNQTIAAGDRLLDRIAEAALTLAKGIPAFKDFSNFSQDPKFWEGIFFEDMSRVFALHGSNRKKLLYYIRTWLDASYRGASKVPPSRLVPMVCKMVHGLQNEKLKAKIFLEMEKQIRLSQFRTLHQSQKTTQIAKVRFETKPKTLFENFAPLLLSGFVFSSLPPKIGATTTSIRQDFQKALAERNITLIKEGRFSVQLFLQAIHLCPQNTTQTCLLPAELSSFDCDNWNLQKMDFSDMKVVNCTILGQLPNRCLLNGSKFSGSNFEGAVIENADLSDAEMQAAVFDGSTIRNTNVDRTRGDASFQKIDSEDSSWIDLRGIFNFSLSRITNGNFQQNVPKQTDGTLSLFATYDFTGADLEGGQFKTVYPEEGTNRFNSQPMNMTFSLIARRAPVATIFDSCDFSIENYHNSCPPNGTGLYAGSVTWIFNLANATLPNSTLTGPSNPGNCSTTQLSYGGQVYDTSFPIGFSFPNWRQKVNSIGWYLRDVSGCGFARLSSCTVYCLVPQGYVDASNNETTLNAEIQNEMLHPSQKYLTNEKFNIKNYLIDQGMGNSTTSCPTTFLDQNTSYENVYWDGMRVYQYTGDQSAKALFTNNLFANAWIAWSGGSHELKDSKLSGSFFGSNTSPNVRIENTTFAWSTYGHKAQTIQNLTVTDSEFVYSTFYPHSRSPALIQRCRFENALITGYIRAIFSDTILKSVRLGVSYYMWPSVRFINTSLIDIRAENDSMLLDSEFDNVTQLSLTIHCFVNRQYTGGDCWKFSNVGTMDLTLYGIRLYKPWFVNIGKLSGIWRQVIIVGQCNKNFFDNFTPPEIYAKNVLVEDMIFDGVQLCGASSADDFKNKLKGLGFILGKNVSVINFYPSPTPYSPSNNFSKFGLIAGITLSVSGCLLAVGNVIRLFCTRRRNRANPPANPLNNASFG